MTHQQGGDIRHPIGPNGSLMLRNVSGRVRLIGVEGDEAIVRCHASGGSEPQLNVEKTDGGLLVEPARASRALFNLRLTIDFDHSYDFDVQVPRGARLDIKTVSADVDGRDLVGEQSYKTVSGDVRLSNGAGRITLLTVSGDVRLHEAAEIELDGATTSGDLTVEAGLVRRLGVRTVSGDVRAKGRLMPGPRHSVETVSGDLSLEDAGGVTVESSRALDLGKRRGGPAVVGDGSARLAFRSMSGDFHVRPGRESVAAGAEAGPPPSAPEPPAPPPPPVEEPVERPSRLDILRALERGEIDVDEATRQLEEASRG